MQEEDKHNLIEQYLAGTLKGSDLSDFQDQLQQDSSLREEVELHRDLSGTLKGEEIHNFRALVNEVDQNWKPSEEKTTAQRFFLSMRPVAAIAASLLLLFLAYQFLIKPKSASPENLFAMNFNTYQMVLNERSNAEETNTTALNTAIQAYLDKNFNLASTQFMELARLEPENKAYLFYATQAQLADQKASDAVPLLETLISTPNHPFTELGRWYLGLAYLQKGDLAKASDIFSQIKEGQDKYEAAKALKKKLDRLN